MSEFAAFRVLHNPSPSRIPETVEDFLRELSAPTLIRLDGRDGSRCRFVVTLLHGNEPSGLKAIHQLLRDEFQPQVTTLLAIVSVAAALAEPGFSHRFLNCQRDMNRLFGPPFDGEQGQLARALLELIREHAPEAVIDLHNTSGDGPAFAVCAAEHNCFLELAALFTHRLVVTDIRLGALMEVSDLGCPILTVECGGAAQVLSDHIALQGLQRFMGAENLAQVDEGIREGMLEMDIYRHPVRLELLEGASLCYADQPRPGMDITLPLHIDRRNFGVARPGSPLAWLGARGLDALRLVDALGNNVIEQYFVAREGKLYPAITLKLFMVTTSPLIAVSDCLLYAVKEAYHQREEAPSDDHWPVFAGEGKGGVLSG
ncbi:M14 family metallopeptidase [Porticoccus sp.]